MLITTVTALGLAATAQGGTLTATASGNGRSAVATFEQAGGNLVITLRNTSTGDALTGRDVLTGLFVDTVDGVTLAPSSAQLGGSAGLLFADAPGSGAVGGEWAFRNDGRVERFTGADFGLGAAALRMFGRRTVIGGDNLARGVAVGGLDFGLVSASDDSTTGNRFLKGRVPLIQDTIVFTLTGLPEGFDPETGIQGVTFQFGPRLSRRLQLSGDLAGLLDRVVVEPDGSGGGNVKSPVANPTPTAFIGGLALLASAAARRRRKAVA